MSLGKGIPLTIMISLLTERRGFPSNTTAFKAVIVPRVYGSLSNIGKKVNIMEFKKFKENIFITLQV